MDFDLLTHRLQKWGKDEETTQEKDAAHSCYLSSHSLEGISRLMVQTAPCSQQRGRGGGGVDGCGPAVGCMYQYRDGRGL